MLETNAPTMEAQPPSTKQRPEWMAVALFAAIQFVHILDFVLMMPLGPSLMADLAINASQFGVLVSSYSLSAASSGILLAFFADRFDRRKLLFFLFLGLVASTAACGMSNSYGSLLLARLFAGVFGGVIGGCIFTIIGELIPVERRGRTMGVVMSSFSIASVAGVPLGLTLAEHQGWQAPFLALAAFSVLLGPSIYLVLPAMNAHLEKVSDQAKPSFRRQLQQFGTIFMVPLHQWGFALGLFVMVSGFTIIPYIAPRLVSDLGLSSTKLSLVYLFGGLGTIVSSQIIGRCVDAFGHLKVFYTVCFLSIGPLLVFSFTGPLSETQIFILMTCFMMFVSGRMVPTMSLVTAAADPKTRGGFMSIFQSVQSASMGLAASFGGLIVTEKATGGYEGFPTLGIISVMVSLCAIVVAHKIAARTHRGRNP